MPKIKVEIEYDWPTDPYWLNPDNVKLCLKKYCVNTKFNVKWVKNGDPWKYGMGMSLDEILGL